MLLFGIVIQQFSGEVGIFDMCNLQLVKVDIKGKVDKYVLVIIVGELDLFDLLKKFDIIISFKCVELIILMFYFGKFVGYCICKG